MDDEAYECPECLKKIPGAEVLAKQKKIEKQQKIKIRLIASGIALAFVALITGIVILVKFLSADSNKEYMKPVNNFIKGCTANDYDKYISAFTDYYGQFLSEQFAYIILGDIPSDDEKLRTAAMLYLDEYYRELIKRYGADFDITYDILSEKQKTADELKKLREEYVKFYPDKLSGVTFDDGYEITITFNIKGKLGVNNVTEQQFILIKIKDDWYMTSYVDLLREKEEPNIEDFK